MLAPKYKAILERNLKPEFQEILRGTIYPEREQPVRLAKLTQYRHMIARLHPNMCDTDPFHFTGIVIDRNTSTTAHHPSLHTHRPCLPGGCGQRKWQIPGVAVGSPPAPQDCVHPRGQMALATASARSLKLTQAGPAKMFAARRRRVNRQQGPGTYPASKFRSHSSRF
jgi:hypothetical protein